MRSCRAGVESKVIRASFRVRSIVASGVRSRPEAVGSTANRATPSVTRAATSSKSALAPSRTNDLWPVSVQAPPASLAASPTSSMRHEPESSASATEITLSPLAIPGSNSALSASSSIACTSEAAMTQDPKNGDTVSARPSSSTTRPSSRKLKPLPPCFSAIASPGRPSSPLIRCQSCRSYPVGSSSCSRTADSAEYLAKNFRSSLCSVACSSESAKSTTQPFRERKVAGTAR